jgi:hypothetical protein
MEEIKRASIYLGWHTLIQGPIGCERPRRLFQELFVELIVLAILYGQK